MPGVYLKFYICLIMPDFVQQAVCKLQQTFLILTLQLIQLPKMTGQVKYQVKMHHIVIDHPPLWLV